MAEYPLETDRSLRVEGPGINPLPDPFKDALKRSTRMAPTLGRDEISGFTFFSER